FSTSRQTLLSIPDTFFTALLSLRIPILRDEQGAIFIDRDPELFSMILNYLRTKDIDISKTDVRTLLHEAEYYAISPLIKRLMLCEDLTNSKCGDVLFCGFLPPPSYIPNSDHTISSHPLENSTNNYVETPATSSSNNVRPGPGSMVRVPENSNPPNRHISHSRNSSLDMRDWRVTGGHSRTASLDMMRHSRNSSMDLNKLVKNDLGLNSNNKSTSQLDFRSLAHFVICYRLKDSTGWQLVFTSPYIETTIERIAINAKVNLSSAEPTPSKMVAISYGSLIRLWSIQDGGNKTDVGTFNLSVRVEYLFFIGSQLVALSSSGKIGVWHAMTQHWQIQDLVPILSFDSAGSFLLLDMQKFPLRMKDNDLLVTELYKDPSNDPITAISVYLTPKTSIGFN
uniref:BTB domain-containing protein n=1 Tax=Megaselia scalaris TaxID=36166 RepID=T1GBP2_MEGSC